MAPFSGRILRQTNFQNKNKDVLARNFNGLVTFQYKQINNTARSNQPVL